MFRALSEFGAPLDGLTSSDFTTAGYYFTLGSPSSQIDIGPAIPGVEFEDCWKRRIVTKFLDAEVNFISRQDLIINKEKVGRLQDLADAEKLRETDPER